MFTETVKFGMMFIDTVKIKKGQNKMTEQETKKEPENVQTFTQDDIDKLKAEWSAKHQEEMDGLASKLRNEFKEKEAKAKAEAEKLAKQANMTELEKANERIKELEVKYKEQTDINELASQKDETRKLMTEAGVDLACLDFCFVPKDIEATKSKIQAFKEYTNNVKKETFESNVQSTVLKQGQPPAENDAFLDGFDNGLHFKN